MQNVHWSYLLKFVVIFQKRFKFQFSGIFKVYGMVLAKIKEKGNNDVFWSGNGDGLHHNGDNNAVYAPAVSCCRWWGEEDDDDDDEVCLFRDSVREREGAKELVVTGGNLTVLFTVVQISAVNENNSKQYWARDNQ